MSDEVDVANDNIERDMGIAQRVAASYRERVEPTGFCLNKNCGMEVDKNKRWCDAGCRDSWEHDRRYNGRK